MKKVYLLVFDRDDFRHNYLRIHKKIKNDVYIENWWHYLKSAYILTSELSAEHLFDEIRKILPNHKFLITEIDLENCEGWLPEKAWEWIEKHA